MKKFFFLCAVCFSFCGYAMNAAPAVYSFEDSEKLAEAQRGCHVSQTFTLIEQKRTSLDGLVDNDAVVESLNAAINSVVETCDLIDQKHRNYEENCNVRAQLYITKALVLKCLFDFLQLVKGKIGYNYNAVISRNQGLHNKLLWFFGAI